MIESQVPIGVIEINLSPIDFGKEEHTLHMDDNELLCVIGTYTGIGKHVRALNAASFQGYLTICQGLLWKRYWVQTNPMERSLDLYDFEQKTKKSKSFSFSCLFSVQNADEEEFPVPCVFLIHCSEAVSSGFSASQNTLVDSDVPCVLVCRADSEIDLESWKHALVSSIAFCKDFAPRKKGLFK